MTHTYRQYRALLLPLLATLAHIHACTDPEPNCRCEGSWEGTITISMACGESACIGTGLTCVAGELVADPAACDAADAGTFEPPPPSDAGVEPATDSGPAACTPSCSGRVCGSDGCGGSCGVCGAGSSCLGGSCLNDCPPNSSRDGRYCTCHAGYTVGPTCRECIVDADGDGCGENAAPTDGGGCACNEGFRENGCACESVCEPGERFLCGECIAFDGLCPSGTTPDGDRCMCDGGRVWDPYECTCADSFEDPAFDAAACSGTPMSLAAAQERADRDPELGSYFMRLRRRFCRDDLCGPWRELGVADLDWLPRASGQLDLDNPPGDSALYLDLEHDICEQRALDAFGRPTSVIEGYFVHGARCSGVGRSELICSAYSLPSQCRSGDDRFLERDLVYQLPIDLYNSPLRRPITMRGTLTDTCASFGYSARGLVYDRGLRVERPAEEEVRFVTFF